MLRILGVFTLSKSAAGGAGCTIETASDAGNVFSSASSSASSCCCLPHARHGRDLLQEVYDGGWVGFSSSSRGYLGYEVIRPTDIRIVSSKRD